MATTSFPRILPGAKTHFPLFSGGRELWHKSVPSAISRAAEWDDNSPGWKAWREYLQNRRQPRPLAQVLGDASAFLWGAGERGPSSTDGLNRRLEKLLRSKQSRAELTEELRYWLAEAPAATQGAGRAFDCLCWCWQLPELARRLPATLWWTLLNRLVETCHNSAQQPLEQDPVSHQILAGELPLTLAYLLPELKACRSLATPAREALTQGLEKIVDNAGFIPGRFWAQLAPLLGVWTRTRILGRELRQGSWTDEVHSRFCGVVLQALRAATPAGGVALSADPASALSGRFWKSALQASEKSLYRRLAEHVLSRPLLGDDPSAKPKVKSLPDAAAESDDSGVAILRSAWKRRSDLLAVECEESLVRTELISGRERLWSGTWELDVRIDGEALVPISAWESVCWVSDEDVVYFELERAFAGGVRLQRQMLLARDDRFLLLADAVLSRNASAVSYRSSLPLGRVQRTEPAAETREIGLRGERAALRVLPLALNEWRQGYSQGSLEVRENNLVLEQTATGGNLFAPLFIDLDPRRAAAPLTWRNLTVAANREIQPADVAVGYRVRIGKQQWIVFRALAERASRTVLGANTWSPFLTSRIKKSGEFETLLEIE